MTLSITITILVLVIGFFVFARVRQAHRESSERDGLTRFREVYGGRYPDSLLLHAYTYLAERHGASEPHYLVSPADDLERVYQLRDLELEDAVIVIADRARARLPRAQDLDELRTRVRTVDDLLRFLEPYFRSEPMPA